MPTILLVYDNSFRVKATRLWNVLKNSVNTICTLDAFRVAMGRFVEQNPDQPMVPGYTPPNSNSLLSFYPGALLEVLEEVSQSNTNLKYNFYHENAQIWQNVVQRILNIFTSCKHNAYNHGYRLNILAHSLSFLPLSYPNLVKNNKKPALIYRGG